MIGKKRNSLKFWWQEQWENMTMLKLLIALGVVVIAVIIIILIMLFRPSKDIMQEKSLMDIMDRGALRVAVRGDLQNFSLQAENENNVNNNSSDHWSGLEIAISKKIAKAILNDEQAIEFRKTNFALRNFFLSQKQVDCLLAISPRDFSQAFIYSEPYYTDVVVILVGLNSEISAIQELQRSATTTEEERVRVGVVLRKNISSDTIPVQHQGAYTVLDEYNKSLGANISVCKYASMPDMLNDLGRGNIDAVAIESALLPLYYDGSKMRMLMNGTLGNIDYSVAALPGNESLIGMINQVIKDMHESGEMANLLHEYKLQDYSIK